MTKDASEYIINLYILTEWREVTMYQAISEIHRAFDKAGLKHSVENRGSHWSVESGMSGEASTYNFIFYKTDDSGNDVSVRVFRLATVPQNKRIEAYRCINRLQQKYRYVRFVLDDDGDVNMEYDFPASYSPIGEGAVEMFTRCTAILDKVYPELMRMLWA